MLLAMVAAVGVSASSFVRSARPGLGVEPVSAAVRPRARGIRNGYLNSEVEPWLDVNPTNVANLVGVWQQDRWSNGGARGLSPVRGSTVAAPGRAS